MHLDNPSQEFAPIDLFLDPMTKSPTVQNQTRNLNRTIIMSFPSKIANLEITPLISQQKGKKRQSGIKSDVICANPNKRAGEPRILYILILNQ